MANIVAYTGVRPLMGCMAALALSLVYHQVRAGTNLSVFFSSELAAGKVSSGVQGFFLPQQALQMLLEGTGLTIQSVA
ncbi:MAG: STN domain-containing protein [Burkholderiaceae bacterium]|nr:STN domain-containing protein [Burkholderiaceae bacterium]